MIVFSGSAAKKTHAPIPVINEIVRVDSLKILGVEFRDDLSMSAHVKNVLQAASQSMYALKIIKAHGLDDQSLSMLFNALVLSRLTYASPAWRGFANKSDIAALQAIINRAVRWGQWNDRGSNIEGFCAKLETKLFTSILNDPHHVLHQFLPPRENKQA